MEQTAVSESNAVAGEAAGVGQVVKNANVVEGEAEMMLQETKKALLDMEKVRGMLESIETDNDCLVEIEVHLESAVRKEMNRARGMLDGANAVRFNVSRNPINPTPLA
jgi:hypothetical protein